MLNFLQADAMAAGSSLVKTLNSGKRVVYKKALAHKFPCTKEFLFRFSKDHPDTLEHYRATLQQLENTGKAANIEEHEEPTIAAALTAALRAVPAGNTNAADYHRLMIGIIEFLFYPLLLNPKKEKEIHDGRKRIDIVVENAARDGILFRLHSIRELPCAFVAIECTNYTTEVGNPELDQLSGRFSVNRGKFGIMCCRQFENPPIFVERCRDTPRDQRGLVIALDDEIVARLLAYIENGRRQNIETELAVLVDEVWVS